MVTTETFQLFNNKLRNVKIQGVALGCTSKLTDRGKVIVECGFDYPEVICDKVYKITETLKMDEVDICAESGGHVIVSVERINAGPRRRW